MDVREAFSDSLLREWRFLKDNSWDMALVSWIPLLLMAVMAWQFSSGVMRDLPIAVVDQDGTSVSRKLTQHLEAAPGLRVVAAPENMLGAQAMIREKKVYAVVLIPRDIQKKVYQGESAPVVAYFNASYLTAGGAAAREIGSAIGAAGMRLVVDDIAAIKGPENIRPAPVAVQTTILFNPQSSYELQLVSLIHPALLHLIFMVAIISALGRELRDATIADWLHGSPAQKVAAIGGKIALYLMIFFVWSIAALFYISVIRGWSIGGSAAMILLGSAMMYLAYSGVSLLIVGISRRMSQSLSAAGLYAGASFAFAGAIFPIESASRFAQIWSALLPYTAYTNLQIEQLSMGADILTSLRHVWIMLAFFIIGSVIGLPAYMNAADNPKLWRRR
ncbi:ABC transporter permease [Parasphingorhabdus sp. JC815]|uniref:ABC transporter permease n=1 Tax=Parasphingorhabdus sp. JC815 TaxID=3232140 RepID=UPI0034575371